jgi:endonuclease I
VLLFTLTDYDAGEAQCVYTGVRVAVPSGPPDHTIMNVEHTWPRSLGTSAPPTECDLHHLFPSDSDANNERANHPFGEVVSDVTWAVGGSMRGDSAAGVVSFEPRDDHKGNVARAMLYMHLRHGLAVTAAEVDLYQAWSAQDPVDLAELRRTLMIGALQGAANPLVVCPEAVDAL